MLIAAAVSPAPSASSYRVVASGERCSAFIPTIVARIDLRAPAARIAPNDEPYSTIRRWPRCHQTRCGMWCPSGCAPVTSDVRQTGVSDGKVVTARRYSPASASAVSVGALRSPTASSKVDAVRPSTTTRIAFRELARLLGKRAQAGVLLACPAACPRSERRERRRLEVAGERDERERERAHRSHQQEHRRPAGGSTASQGAARDDGRARATEQSTGSGTDRFPDPVDGDARDDGGDHRGNDRDDLGAEPGGNCGDSEADGDAPACAHADAIDLPHSARQCRRLSTTWARWHPFRFERP